MKTKTFKSYDKVLVRANPECKWECDFYSHYRQDSKYPHKTLGYGLKDNNILPYEGNEHLVGTIQEPDEVVELKEGEWIVIFDKAEMYYPPFFIGKFSGLHANMFIANESCERELAIHFSDFNPNNMEETSRHILCVRNGRIVRYHGKD